MKEEFQSANEEILSANEELQSTSEKLDTSKEELQSTNDELYTLNSELRTKNNELYDLSNDISNLLTSMRIPVVMLDGRRHIRRITPAATRLFKVLPTDIGRPFADIKLNIDPTDLTPSDLDRMVVTMLDTVQPAELEVRDLEGRWHTFSIQPYRTQDNKIDGAVLALQDIDAVKCASELLRKSSEFFEGVVNTVRGPLLALDNEMRVVLANRAFLETFKVSPGDTLNRFLYDLGNGQWNIPLLRTLLERILPEREVVTDFEVNHDFESIGLRKMLVNACWLIQPTEREPMILLSIEDVTERRQAEAAMIRSEKLAASGRLAATLAHEINNPLQAVTNLVDLLRQSSQLTEEDRAYTNMAMEELSRVTHLVRQSLVFYRETTSAVVIDLEEVVASILALYGKPLAAKKIAVNSQYEVGGATIASYPHAIRQAFSTLLVNAMEAVPDGGTIAIRVCKSFRGKNPAIRGVRVTVADNGGGIAPRNRSRIFEPFFTTKGERGTGLGLWVARGIVDGLGGTISVHSSVHSGKSGTCFSIFLPNRMPDAR